jgi:hypothetical protein
MMHQRHDRFSTAVSTHANLFITRLQKTQHRLEIHRDQYLPCCKLSTCSAPLTTKNMPGALSPCLETARQAKVFLD